MTLDTQLFYLLNNLAGQSTLMDKAVVFCGSYLAYIVVVAFVLLVFLSQYPKRMKWEILVVAGTSALISRFGAAELIRVFIHRPRPFSVLPVHQLLTDSSWSFPSGHATFFFAMAMAIYLYNKKWGIGFFIATIVITAGRVAAGVHYPSDIIAGALIGIVVAYATFYAVRYMIRRITASQLDAETSISTH